MWNLRGTREEFNQFITAVNSFHPALKYTWEISDTSLAFLDIKVSVEGNGLCTSVHYKPTGKYKTWTPSVDRVHGPGQSNKLIGSQHYKRLRRRIAIEFHSLSHFTLTFHPHNHAVKSIILKNFKLLQNDPDTGRIFSQPPLISFKRNKNIGNFLVRSAFQTTEQPGTFKCARARCKTCPFICNVEKLSGPKRSIKITDHFTCTSANVIYCITCTLCKKLHIGETGRRLAENIFTT